LTIADIKTEVKNMIEPAVSYFQDRIFGMLGQDVAYYKILRYANPLVYYRQLSTLQIADFKRSISALNTFTEEEVNSMFKEISRFIAILQGIPTDSYPSSPPAQMDFAVQFW
jgi:hypothetical protein